ncbi:MAG: pyridoxamine 5'-phosphate oxidase family protein [Rhodobacteraceae bacterium]|nr:pyridoxamine 5'-phosphate oxidase family protein [Paracoccaceae bacterium]
MTRAFAEIAFTPAVRTHQERMGSARSYGRFLETPDRSGDRIGINEAAFIADRDGFYQATVSETGWPYVQFRGGPRGFLKVLDEKTIAYADFSGNRQYVSLGNLTENARISLILMDYPNRRRLKIWGTVEVVEGAEAADSLFPSGADAIPERAILIRIEAFDWNCPRHIPERLTLEELEPHLAPLRKQLAELQAENARLKAAQPA